MLSHKLAALPDSNGVERTTRGGLSGGQRNQLRDVCAAPDRPFAPTE
jgi:hypothetical protein